MCITKCLTLAAYEARYDWVGDFTGGKAEVRHNGEKFHIRPDGTRID